MVKRIIIIVIFSLFAQRSSSSLTLGTCNLQCNGKDGQQEMGLPSSSIREHLRGYPGKMGAIGLPGPIGPKGEPGASCDSLNEGDAFFKLRTMYSIAYTHNTVDVCTENRLIMTGVKLQDKTQKSQL